MAASASASMVSPAGLGTRLSGKRLNIKPTTSAVAPRLRGGRAVVIKAKYGDKSVYFDLDDIQNTTGNWDLYGSDGPSPYNGLQSKFFETFAGPFARRRYLLRFLLLGFGGAIAFAGSNASGDYVPIIKGPQGPPQPGPNGKI